MMPVKYFLAACLLAGPLTAAGFAQADAAADDGEEMMTLNLPDDLTVRLLIDYISKKEGLNFIYDPGMLNASVQLKAPNKLPASAMRTLLESVMRMRGLTIVDTEIEGLKKIERVQQLSKIAKSIEESKDVDPEKATPSVVVSRVFEIEHTPTNEIVSTLQRFLSGPNANIMPFADRDMVVITDYADQMKRIEEMFALIDQPGREAEIKFLDVEHMDAPEVVKRVNQLLTAQAKASKGGKPRRANLTLLPDDRLNQVAIVGLPEEIAEAEAMIETVDVSLGLETKLYALEYASPSRVDELVRALIGERKASRLYQSTIDDQANVMIVNTTPEIHERVEALRERVDVAEREAQSPVRFYKLEHARASEVLATLREIEGAKGVDTITVDGVSVEADRAETRGESADEESIGPTEEQVNRRPQPGDDLAELRPDGGGSVELPEARIMADEPTNTLIVIAEPSMQVIYKRLIERLDVRRPQVLIEATVVVLDTTDDFTLGVEIFSGEDVNGGTLLNFSQFGLTTADSQPGSITLNPGTGFTGALIDANIAEVVIRALESDRRAKVVSRPSVLINDNATGSLVSEQEEPFETITNSSTSVERTTFGGFASAGTNIEVSPQISEGDHLNLKYTVTLSSFREDDTASASTLPPARNTNTLTSEATIPDGHTIIVGGLTRENFTDTIDRVPFLGSVPVLEYLFSSRRETQTKSTLFVFLHAVILRDDKFEDLKILSAEAAARADIDADFPQSEPVAIP